MLHVKEAIVVEGIFDKKRIQPLCDALIVTTDGFRIFRDREKQSMLRQLAEKRGLLVLTDPDRAGFQIRAFLKSFIPAHQLRHAYIPDIYGKERRKDAPSKEGKLGVEGMTEECLAAILAQAECECVVNPDPLQKSDLYEIGLSGGANSHALRCALSRALGIPTRLSANALLEVLNAMMSKNDLLNFLDSPDFHLYKEEKL